MTIIDTCDEEHGVALSLESGHVESKERHKLKLLLVMAITFIVLAGAIPRGTQHQHGFSAAPFFEKRSLLDLSGLCGRNDNFEQYTFNTVTTGVSIAKGETKQYKTTVPKNTVPYAVAEYSNGELSLFMSYRKEKPDMDMGASDVSVSCTTDGNPGPGGIACILAQKSRDRAMYVWVVGDAATTFTLKIGDRSVYSGPGS